jgi:hypothetical protein
MKLLYEWGIPSAGFLIWVVLVLIIIPAFVRRLKKRTDRTERTFDKIFSPQYRLPLLLTSPIGTAMRSQNTLF